MLYWGEGYKSRHEVRLSNADSDMMVFYMRFLRESLQVKEVNIKMSLNFYLNNGITQEEIEDYWLNLLNLNASQMRESIVNNQPSSSKQQGRKLLYGMCELGTNSTRLSQHIYGAIQEYVGVDKPE